MALKLTYHASEFLFDIENLPSQLLEEMERFKERNKIIKERYCEKCFNAHILKKSDELCIGKDSIIKLKEKIRDEIGHDGYYLDGVELIRL